MSLDITIPHTNNKEIPFEEAVNRYYGNWIWRATYAILDHQNCDFTPDWLASALNVSTTQIHEAIEGLKALGLAKLEDGKVKCTKTTFIIPQRKEDYADRIEGHKDLSYQILSKMLPAKGKSSGHSGFVASNSEKFQTLMSDFKKLVDEFAESSKDCEKDGLYAITISGTDLTLRDEE